MSSENVLVEKRGAITIISINRPSRRNAVDPATATLLRDAFLEFDQNPESAVAVFTGTQGTFCAGADLKAVAAREMPDEKLPEAAALEQGPMGPSQLLLSKPVIAAVEGHAVAGGFELAMWCDMRVAAEDAVFGVFCRRWGVPLVDGGTVRLSRALGHSHALDLILTGRPVSGEEARSMGVANRLVAPGTALSAAIELAEQLAGFPQLCMRADRLSSYQQWDCSQDDALRAEFEAGLDVINSGETLAGAKRFAEGAGRHGAFT